MMKLSGLRALVKFTAGSSRWIARGRRLEVEDAWTLIKRTLSAEDARAARRALRYNTLPASPKRSVRKDVSKRLAGSILPRTGLVWD